MIRLFIAGICLLLSIISQAQQEYNNFSFDKYISDSLMDTNPYGVYLTHEEFLIGRPSIHEKFEVIKRGPGRQTAIPGAKSSVLGIFDPETNRMKRLKGKFWCAFDGRGMYLMKDLDIYRLEYSGRFNICTTSKWKRRYSSFAPYTGNSNYSNHTTSTVSEVHLLKIIDFKTNEWYEYSVGGMKKLLLLNSPTLYDQFMNETRKKSKLGLYFKKLNSL